MAGDREQKFSALFELWYLLKQQDFSCKYVKGVNSAFSLLC